MQRLRQIQYLFCLVILLISCRTEIPERSNISEINIRLKKDPLQLNPVFNPTSTAREVFQYLYLPICDYHPTSNKLVPILIEKIPDGVIVKEGPNAGLISYDFRFKSDAKWHDGKPITAQDYAFTLKSVLVPSSNAAVWRVLIEQIKDIKLYESDDKRMTVFMNADFMLSKETALTSYVLPRHIHDPENTLSKIDYKKFTSDNTDISENVGIKSFVEKFNSPVFTRDSINNSGPYKLTSWVTNQSIVLEKKENYWGSKYDDNPFFQAGSNKLIFKIIPDENNAVTALKNKELDIMTFSNSANFNDLKENPNFNSDFVFYTPQQMSYNYIALNNEREELKDNRVRKALAHLVNIQWVIDSIDYGYGTRTIGHFNPTRSYYNQDLKPVEYSIEKAKSLLDEAGWSDTNNDGTRDKALGGNQLELELDLIISGSVLTENIGILMSDAAKQAGIKINLIRKKGSLLRKEHIRPRDYDMFTYGVNQDMAPDDPYSRFHSSESESGGNNYFNYNNSEADQIMEQIRMERNEASRDKLYKELQTLMYTDQPIIFLYSPKLKFVANRDFEAAASSKRPGYLANTFKQKVKS